MKTRQLLLDMAVTIPLTFVVAALVTYLYGWLVRGTGQVSWDTALQLAIIFGVVLPLSRAWSSRPA